MYPVNKKNEMIIRTRKHIQMEVQRFKSKGSTDEEIIDWLEHILDKELGLSNYFDSVNELAAFVNLPVSKFHIVWM